MNTVPLRRLATVVDAELETVRIFGHPGGAREGTVDFPAPDVF